MRLQRTPLESRCIRGTRLLDSRTSRVPPSPPGTRLFGCRCAVYMGEGVSASRQHAIEGYGASVVRVGGSYDAVVAKSVRLQRPAPARWASTTRTARSSVPSRRRRRTQRRARTTS
eukprot:SAG11_NODE_2746_length_3014_cov_3.898799_2_plen_116_part_00